MTRYPGRYARPYLPSCTSVSVRLQVRICPVAGPYLSGCTSVSVRLQVRIYPVAGPYLSGCRSVSARLQVRICAVAGMYLPGTAYLPMNFLNASTLSFNINSSGNRVSCNNS